jgi:hypothetical protein
MQLLTQLFAGWHPFASIPPPEFFEERKLSSGEVVYGPGATVFYTDHLFWKVFSCLSAKDIFRASMTSHNMRAITGKHFSVYMTQLLAVDEIRRVASCIGYIAPEFTSENVWKESCKIAQSIQKFSEHFLNRKLDYALASELLLDKKNIRRLFCVARCNNTESFFAKCSICNEDGERSALVGWRNLEGYCSQDVKKIVVLGSTLRETRALWIPEEVGELSSLRALALHGETPIYFPPTLSLPDLKLVTCSKGRIIIGVPPGVLVEEQDLSPFETDLGTPTTLFAFRKLKAMGFHKSKA